MFRHDELWLRGLLASRNSSEMMRAGALTRRLKACDGRRRIGRALAESFFTRGAARLLAD